MLIWTLIVRFSNAQTCNGASGKDKIRFDLCINQALIDTEGIKGSPDANYACVSLQSEQKMYFQCLCNRFTELVACYNALCPGDPQKHHYLIEQSQFCFAYEQHVLFEQSPPQSAYYTGSLPTETEPNARFTRGWAQILGSILVFGEIFLLNIATNFI